MLIHIHASFGIFSERKKEFNLLIFWLTKFSFLGSSDVNKTQKFDRLWSTDYNENTIYIYIYVCICNFYLGIKFAQPYFPNLLTTTAKLHSVHSSLKKIKTKLDFKGYCVMGEQYWLLKKKEVNKKILIHPIKGVIYRD